MKIIFTGTGTSQGVPVIGCECAICLSGDQHDKRLRSGLYLSEGDTHIAIDVGPDFRQQMLSVEARTLDGILLTHEHNDHIAGLDDIRPFNYIQKQPVRVYATERTAADVRHRFSYIFAEQAYPGAPRVELIPVKPYIPFYLGKVEVMPFTVYHGKLSVLGFRFGRFTYITDANDLPPRSVDIVRGSEVLVLNALHHRKHHSHFNLEQAIEWGKRLNAGLVYFTHVSHQMGKHGDIQPTLPDGYSLAYDGLTLNI